MRLILSVQLKAATYNLPLMPHLCPSQLTVFDSLLHPLTPSPSTITCRHSTEILPWQHFLKSQLQQPPLKLIWNLQCFKKITRKTQNEWVPPKKCYLSGNGHAAGSVNAEDNDGFISTRSSNGSCRKSRLNQVGHIISRGFLLFLNFHHVTISTELTFPNLKKR